MTRAAMRAYTFRFDREIVVRQFATVECETVIGFPDYQDDAAGVAWRGPARLRRWEFPLVPSCCGDYLGERPMAFEMWTRADARWVYWAFPYVAWSARTGILTATWGDPAEFEPWGAYRSRSAATASLREGIPEGPRRKREIRPAGELA